jgi:hypothetical protein
MWSVSRHPPRDGLRVGGVTVVANLIPLVGVLTLGWDVHTLLVLYWIEGLTTVVLAAVKALFAERGSPGVGAVEPLHELREKRGGWRPLPGLPQIYPRNVPFAASILGGCAVAILPLSALYWATTDAVVQPSLGLLAAVAALVTTQVADLATDYPAKEAYTEVSAKEVLREPALLGLVVFVLGLVAVAGDRTASIVLLGGVVAVKTAVSVSRMVADQTDLPVPSVLDSVVDDDLVDPLPVVETPDGPVRERITVAPTPVLLGSLPLVALGFLHRSTFAVLAGLAFAVLAGGPIWFVPAVMFFVAVAGVRIGSYYLRYGTIEYRRYDRHLVAYDTALGAAQWSVPVASATFSVRNAVPDRLLGTGTLEISGAQPGDRDVQFGPVADLDDAVATLDLPVADTRRPERDVAVIVAASLLALSFLAVPVGLAFSPQVDNPQLVGLAVALGPFFLLPVGLLCWAALSRI